MLKARKINLFFVFILISFILSDFLGFFSENLILEINNFKYIFIFYLLITAAFILLCYLLNKLKLNLYNTILVSFVLLLNLLNLPIVYLKYIFFLFLIISIIGDLKKTKFLSKFYLIFSVIFLIYNFFIFNIHLYNFKKQNYSEFTSQNLYKENIFSKNFFLFVLDTHPAPKNIEKFFPEAIFFLDYLKDDGFIIKSISNPTKSKKTSDNILPILNNDQNHIGLSNSEKKNILRGSNFLNKIVKYNNSNYLFFDGSKYDTALSCDPMLVDYCLTDGDYDTHLKLIFNAYLKKIPNKLKNLFVLSSNNLFFHLYKNYVVKDLSTEDIIWDWDIYRGEILDFRKVYDQIKKFENFFIYAHFYNPHPPYSMDKNCKKYNTRKPLKYKYRNDFIICTNKMMIQVLEDIKKNFKNSSILIISDSGESGVTDNQSFPISLKPTSENNYNDQLAFFAFKPLMPPDDICTEAINSLIYSNKILQTIRQC